MKVKMEIARAGRIKGKGNVNCLRDVTARVGISWGKRRGSWGKR